MLTGSNFMGENGPERAWARKLGLLSVIVVDLVGYSGAGIALGYLATSQLGAPWWVILMTSLAGLSLAIYRLYVIAKRELE